MAQSYVFLGFDLTQVPTTLIEGGGRVAHLTVFFTLVVYNRPIACNIIIQNNR